MSTPSLRNGEKVMSIMLSRRFKCLLLLLSLLALSGCYHYGDHGRSSDTDEHERDHGRSRGHHYNQ